VGDMKTFSMLKLLSRDDEIIYSERERENQNFTSSFWRFKPFAYQHVDPKIIIIIVERI
jgi:hypothetical protein